VSRIPISRLSGVYVVRFHCEARGLIHSAILLPIKRQEVIVPSRETSLLLDYEPSQQKNMLICNKHLECKFGYQEEVESIIESKVWDKVLCLMGPNTFLSTRSSKLRKIDLVL
jgi:hypothetical protein